MSALAVDAKQISLQDLLDAVEQGTAGLPAFQRDFDWSTSDVVSLLATLLSDWPAGSLLLMGGRPEFFEVRPFEDGPELSGTVKYVVLDGQQRLTALFHAIRGRGDVAYVLRAGELVKSDGSAEAIEELITLVPRGQWRREYSLERQSRERLVPIHELRTASDFFAWRDRVIDATAESHRGEVGKLLADVYRSHLGRLNTYAFPAVLLDNDLPPAAVARIFERINLTGLRLNTFDLLVARVYNAEWNLRDRWETARRESEPIAHWLGDDGLPVIQAIALNLEEDVRQPALLDLKAREIRDTWDTATQAMEAAVLKLREIGVPDPGWMPYRGLLLPLADRAMRWGASSLQDEGQLATWFWARSFGMDYGVASSTRIALDSRLLSDEAPDWSTASFAIDRRLLRNATRRQQSALWAAFTSMLASHRPRDLLTGEIIEDPAADAVVVSLFPRGEGDLHLRVLGMVLLTRSSARLLRRDRGRFLADTNQEALGSQLLPSGALLEAVADPTAFLRARVGLLQDRIDAYSGTPISWFDGRDE
ncbi:DUF262 domain-containing protein [Curtobacterium flaccumfaciens pv. flaccumfaciens]|uniref:DUF262 domain-containing protein n=1 Tax=Curtobacterium flaccumfaciens TaxID=2035 RepID=UPI001BCC175B|nr:DUF262 domain-containing protein [Curtobacterium flaccumfaciens]QVG65556.1 DUF262 domain-containing protein [Curtobacterium flaccumfaciens pv. flaccumfaciens]